MAWGKRIEAGALIGARIYRAGTGVGIVVGVIAGDGRDEVAS